MQPETTLPAAADPASDSRQRTLTIAIAAVLFVAFVVVPGVLMATTPHPHGTLYDDPVAAADFTLPRADGSGTFTLSEARGDVVVLYFGYTSCPDVCPATLYDLRRAKEELGEDGEDLRVVFVTIDPEVDTPEKIEEYLAYFDPTFTGLYGTEAQIEAVRDAYEVRVLREDEGETIPGYGITHTTSMFVIDREGILKLRMHHDTDVEYLTRDLRYVLKGRL